MFIDLSTVVLNFYAFIDIILYDMLKSASLQNFLYQGVLLFSPQWIV